MVYQWRVNLGTNVVFGQLSAPMRRLTRWVGLTFILSPALAIGLPLPMSAVMGDWSGLWPRAHAQHASTQPVTDPQGRHEPALRQHPNLEQPGQEQGAQIRATSTERLGDAADQTPEQISVQHLRKHAAFTPPPLDSLTIEAVLGPVLSKRRNQTVRVRRGDTVERVLTRAGAPRDQAGQAIAALGEVYNARSLRAGQNITVYLTQTQGKTQLFGLSLAPDKTRTVQVSRTAAGAYNARSLDVPVTKQLRLARGRIATSFYVDALKTGASPQLVADIANVLAYSVDFQREIYPDDPFEILFEEWVTPDGEQVRTGDFLYIRFAPQQRRTLEYWRFEDADGQTGYYDPSGESAKRFLMKTPINGARLSSNFGPRRHPVLGYNRMHKGTDFAARPGTPIYAAGDGVIERADRYGSYGNYVRIRHANGYKTAYAHLSRFARATRTGRRVTQGQTIGYVGATGRVTGPHLHYEVLRNGKHINPMSMRAPTGRRLNEDEREAFLVEREIIDRRRAQAAERQGLPNAAHALDNATGPAEVSARMAGGPDARG